MADPEAPPAEAAGGLLADSGTGNGLALELLSPISVRVVGQQHPATTAHDVEVFRATPLTRGTNAGVKRFGLQHRPCVASLEAHAQEHQQAFLGLLFATTIALLLGQALRCLLRLLAR